MTALALAPRVRSEVIESLRDLAALGLELGGEYAPAARLIEAALGTNKQAQLEGRDAAIIALRECGDDTRKICEVYRKRRDALVTGLKRAGWTVEPPRGSMFLWAPVPEPYRAAGSLEFAKLLMEKALVAVSPGIGFGPMGEGHVRFALVENEQRIRQATKSIKQFLKLEI